MILNRLPNICVVHNQYFVLICTEGHIYWVAGMLKFFGPSLGRPHVDTRNGLQYANMKELRFDAGDGVWRVAFAFDTKRKAILLVGGDKSGGSEKQFYKQLIKKADERYRAHLQMGVK